MSKFDRRVLFSMVAVLLAATFLRLVAWRSAPPGLRFDEMLVVTQTDAIRAGARPIYIDDLAEEPLYHYLFAAAQELLGEQLFTLRWLSLALGLITVAALYALGRQMFGVRVGVIAALLAAASFWALMYSRVGLRIIALPALVTPAMFLLWRGLTRARRRDVLSAGVLFGLSAYTYSATRLLPLVFVAFLGYLFLFNRAQFRRHGGAIAMTMFIALAIALPMAIHIATVPAAERRLGEVEGPLDALQRGDIQPLINSTAITAAMFIAKGDPEWLYNIPDRPVFDPIVGIIFYAAIFISLRRFRHAPYALVLLWLGAGLLPPMLTWPAASNSHGILAQTPAFLSAAIGLDAIAANLSNRVSFRGAALRRRGISAPDHHGIGLRERFLAPLGMTLSATLATAFIVGVLAIQATVSIHDYFNRWVTEPTVQTEQAAKVVKTAQFFGENAVSTPLVFSSGDVTHWNPWMVTAFRLNTPPGYTNARWFDARSSFIFPRGQTDLTLINAANDDAPALLDSRLIEDLFPVVEPSPLATNYFSATHVISSLNIRLITLTQVSVSWPDGSAAHLPLDFGDHLQLIGYEVRKPIVQPGKNIRLTTYWRAKNLGLEPLSFFVHVLDAKNRIATQWDGYNYSPNYVQPGDIIVQVHFIPIPADFAEGDYRLALGLYYPKIDQQPRVPIVFNGQPVADRVLLQSVAIKNEQ